MSNQVADLGQKVINDTEKYRKIQKFVTLFVTHPLGNLLHF